MKEVVGIEKEVEIFCSLRKEKALHPVRQAVVANILYSSISTRSSSGESGPVLALIFDKEMWNLVECWMERSMSRPASSNQGSSVAR